MTDREHLKVQQKKECDYGERCYRKNPSHFQEYEHSHLSNLLTTLKKINKTNVPDDLNSIVSKQTLNEQLNIVRKLQNSSDQSSNSQFDRLEGDSGNRPGSSRKRQDAPSSNRNSKPNEEPQAKRLHNSLSERCDQSKVSSSPSSGQREYQHSSVDRSPSTSDDCRPLSSAEYKQKMHSARNLSEAMRFHNDVKKRSQGSIVEKHRSASPYHFFLTSVTDSPQTHKEPLSLQMFDILDPSLGDLESSLQINFMVEFGWLMAQYHISNQRGKPITLLYGNIDAAEDDLKTIKHVTTVNVKCPSPFGSHHTKMCVLAYQDGSVRVCVHTANLIESDWNNYVQGVWLSPACPALPHEADTSAGESPTNFKHDLIQYLSAYKLPELQQWIAKLRRVDFSKINVFFVASTPGSHKGVDNDKWGWPKLGRLLKQHVQITPKNGCGPSTWQIIAQCSSIGTLGPEPTSWFCGEVKQAMSGGLGLGLHSPPPIRLVYPTFNNVAGCYDGLLGGGCLPYSTKTHAKQTWLQQYMYQWKCDGRHRTRAMPHIKTYCRVSPDLSQVCWFHLTSANLSKAAWGTRSKAGATNILSYEAGVLFLPKFVTGSLSFPIKASSTQDPPVFPMPYDLPLTPFSSNDVPWFIDMLC